VLAKAMYALCSVMDRIVDDETSVRPSSFWHVM